MEHAHEFSEVISDILTMEDFFNCNILIILQQCNTVHFNVAGLLGY